jgi:hypothetical protein
MEPELSMRMPSETGRSSWRKLAMVWGTPSS